MSRDNHKDVAEKLALLASAAEDLHALLTDEEPSQAQYYQSVAARTRANATCWRLHKVLPILRVSPITEAIKAAKQFERGIASVANLIPKDKGR